MTDTAQNMILGALVADAASLGLHWIYDQAHIAKVAPDEPAFVAPDAANFEGVMGFYAHGNRVNGQNSQYGEQLKVMQTALAESGGQFDPHGFVTAFQAHFGYGGTFVGYIDHATGGSLDNFRAAAQRAEDAAGKVPWDGDGRITGAVLTKAHALSQQFTGDTLRAEFEHAVRRTHDDDAVVAYGLQVLDAVAALPPVNGAVDMQSPAIAKLPPLVIALKDADDAQFAQDVTRAIRLTSDHPTAVAFGLSCARMLRAALNSNDISTIIEAGRSGATAEVDGLLAQALAMTGQDSNAAATHFGLACDLGFGVPVAVHTIATASGFADGVRRNIYAGGDNCGRAILLGAVLGAVYGIGGDAGIPQAWIEKLDQA